MEQVLSAYARTVQLDDCARPFDEMTDRLGGTGGILCELAAKRMRGAVRHHARARWHDRSPW
jgi:hypothetical protein